MDEWIFFTNKQQLYKKSLKFNQIGISAATSYEEKHQSAQNIPSNPSMHNPLQFPSSPLYIPISTNRLQNKLFVH